jgi:PhnB protein
MISTSTYLSFEGNCRESMTFYQQCTGSVLELNAYPDTSGAPSTEPDAKIMHAQLTVDGVPILMASDTPMPGTIKPGNNFSVSVQCESVEEIDTLFDKLSQGGQILAPLDTAPWGARFGMLTDKFGIQWMLNHTLHRG